MKIFNQTPFPVEIVQASDKTGQVSAVIIIKATYNLPTQNDRVPRMAEDQIPPLPTDLFEGEPGLSTPYFESDYAIRKSRCDVVVKATAFAPGGQPVRELLAGFRVGACTKQVRVVGDRTWERTLLSGLNATRPEPFLSMPITYSRAYGGHWDEEEGVSQLECFGENPIGRGFAKLGKNRKLLPGRPLPNLEHPKASTRKPDGGYPPCSFGPIGRSWTPRAKLAGTYDDHWKEAIFPLLPPDFDDAFFQCVLPDQQIDFPKGGETVELWNLHPALPHVRFPLPTYRLPLLIVLKTHQPVDLEPVIDGVLIDADEGTLSLVWRAELPLKRSLGELLCAGVGRFNRQQRMKIILGGDCACGCKGHKQVPEEEDTDPYAEAAREGEDIPAEEGVDA